MSYPIFLAEGERFELSEDFRPRWFSRPVHSTALPPLRRVGILLYFRWRNIFASNQDVQAIPGATIVVSPNPSLAIHGESFGPQKASLFVGFADRVSPSLVFKTSAFNRSATPPAGGNLTIFPVEEYFRFKSGCASHPWRDYCGFAKPQPRHPWRVVRPSKSFAFRRLRRPGLTLAGFQDQCIQPLCHPSGGRESYYNSGGCNIFYFDSGSGSQHGLGNDLAGLNLSQMRGGLSCPAICRTLFSYRRLEHVEFQESGSGH